MVNSLIDSLLWIDFIVNMFTTYENEDNSFEISRKKVIVKYLKAWFFVDFIAAFPF